MKQALDFLKSTKDIALATVGLNGRPIYDTNPVLQRLYPDYRAMTYFSMEIDHLDYYDLTPTPPILRHYDKSSGLYQDLDPYHK